MGTEAGLRAEVRIHYLGIVRQAAGTREERVRLERPTTLGVLLRGLADRHGEDFRDHLFENGELSRGSSVLIDGTNCRALGGLDARVDGGGEVEVVVFGPPIAGG